MEIERCIAFYAKLFVKYSNLDWVQVQETASRFKNNIIAQWPWYYEELLGKTSMGLRGKHREQYTKG